MTNHPVDMKHLGDLGVSLLWLVSVTSHFAQLLAPIFTLISSVFMTLWWVIRLREWHRTRKVPADD